ncbi:hypothetical protein ACFCZ4_34040 [Streptomyces microflavus]|uniref:hypothetical protein n=1 Tax=Streptomyces microflavus TaxID=1919 RepID=UPI0035DAB249
MDNANGILLHIPSAGDENRAIEILDRLIQKTGTGMHRLTLTVEGINGTAFAEFAFLRMEDDMTVGSIEKADQFCVLLAVAVSGAHHSGLVMRTQAETESCCGWRFKDGDPLPLNRAEVFNAYCHNAATGEVIAPQPGIEYADAPVIHI